MNLTKRVLLLTLSLLMLPLAAQAEDNKADANLHPDLRKILEEQAQKESDAWGKSNEHYAKVCLKGIEPGKPVPQDKAVKTTACYIKTIDEHVRPVALNQTMVDDMTGEWKTLARKYGAGQIDHKEWMAGMDETQKKFSVARIQIIKGLVADAARQQAQAAQKQQGDKKE